MIEQYEKIVEGIILNICSQDKELYSFLDGKHAYFTGSALGYMFADCAWNTNNLSPKAGDYDIFMHPEGSIDQILQKPNPPDNSLDDLHFDTRCNAANYDALNAAASYQIEFTSKREKFNITTVVPKGFGYIDGMQIISAFDINSVQVAYSFYDKKFYYTDAFVDFIVNKQLYIDNLFTPSTSLLRLFSKYDQLKDSGVYCNLELETQKTAFYLMISQRLYNYIRHADFLKISKYNNYFNHPLITKYIQFYTTINSNIFTASRIRLLPEPMALITVTPTLFSRTLFHPLIKQLEDMRHTDVLYRLVDIIFSNKYSKYHKVFLAYIYKHYPNVNQFIKLQGYKNYIPSGTAMRVIKAVDELMESHPRLSYLIDYLPISYQYKFLQYLNDIETTDIRDAVIGKLESTRSLVDNFNPDMLFRDFSHFEILDVNTKLKNMSFDQALDTLRLLIKKNEEIISKEDAEILTQCIDISGFNSEGYKITELVTPMDLRTEGKAMHHCVGGYSDSVRNGYCRIFSIINMNDRSDRSTLEISIHKKIDGNVYSMSQCRTFGNTTPNNSNMVVASKLINYLNTQVQSQKILDNIIINVTYQEAV